MLADRPLQKRICDQLGVVRLDLPEARMDKRESRYRASFCPVSRRRSDLVPSFPPLLFNILGDVPSITPISGIVSTQSSGRPTVDLSPFSAPCARGSPESEARKVLCSNCALLQAHQRDRQSGSDDRWSSCGGGTRHTQADFLRR